MMNDVTALLGLHRTHDARSNERVICYSINSRHQSRCDIIEGFMAASCLNASGRYIDVLRTSAHLCRKKTGCTGDSRCRFHKVLTAFKYHGVNACSLGEKLLAGHSALEMSAITRAAGEIDNLHCRVVDEALRDGRIERVDSQRDKVWIAAIVRQHLTAFAHSNRHG